MALLPARGSWKSGGSGLEEVVIVDEKMRKRKMSNRESAKRSRVRKQNHIEEMVDEVDQLEKQQQQLKAKLNIIRQLWLNEEAEALGLRTQMEELSCRLAFVNEISSCSYAMSVNCSVYEAEYDQLEYCQETNGVGSFFMDSWTNYISQLLQTFLCTEQVFSLN